MAWGRRNQQEYSQSIKNNSELFTWNKSWAEFYIMEWKQKKIKEC